MRFACLSTVAPGGSLAAQCAAIAAAGCEGVEVLLLPETPLTAWQREVRSATASAGIVPAAVIIGGLALYERDQDAYLAAALDACAEFGALAVVTPEYRAQTPLPLFPPYAEPPAHERAMVARALEKAVAQAERLGVTVALEPLTPFEGRFFRCVDDALAACSGLGSPQLGLALDTHNMHMTEASTVASIRVAGPAIRHMHLADNNRRLPGRGQIAFAPLLAALREVEYAAWYSFECAVEAPFSANLATTIGWLRGL